MRFWLDLGVVDGFRVDAVADLFEDPNFRDEPLTGLTNNTLSVKYTTNIYSYHLSENYDMVSHWRNLLNKYDARIMAVEIYANINKVMRYYTAGVDFPFNYNFIDNVKNSSTPQDFKKIIDSWMNNLPEGKIVNWAVSTRFFYNKN